MTRTIYVVYMMFPDNSILMQRAFFSEDEACNFIDKQEDPSRYDYELTWLEGNEYNEKIYN